MRQWFLSPRRSSRIIAPRKPARKCLPSVEQLEDRTVLQSGLTPNQAFVSAAYQVLLNRSPDSGGLAGWSAALANSTALMHSFERACRIKGTSAAPSDRKYGE